jgi:hypothetical protein
MTVLTEPVYAPVDALYEPVTDAQRLIAAVEKLFSNSLYGG